MRASLARRSAFAFGVRFTFAFGVFALAPLALAGCGGARPAAVAAVAPGCDALRLDLRTGRLNGLTPTASMAEVKRQLPCATGETAEGGPFNYGGGVFFLNHGMFFYTHRDFIEVRAGFRGVVEPALLGQGREAVEAAFGPAVREETNSFGTAVHVLHTTPYGCLGVMVAPGTGVSELEAYATPCDAVVLED